MYDMQTPANTPQMTRPKEESILDTPDTDTSVGVNKNLAEMLPVVKERAYKYPLKSAPTNIYNLLNFSQAGKSFNSITIPLDEIGVDLD